MPNVSWPREVTAQICQHTDYDDLQSLCDAVGGMTVDQAIYHRFDPRVYFKQLTANSDKLLWAMRDCAAVLSGSRAAGFFYPTACTNDSDWDFYCTSCEVSAAKFSFILSELGVIWETRTSRRSSNVVYGDTFQLLSGTIGTQKIQVIWLTNPRDTTFNAIATFHSSIVQCFVSGWCAVSMYHNVSAKKQMFSWSIDAELTPSKALAAPACVAKYVLRGFEEVPYSTTAIADEIPGNELLSWTPRCISDRGCLFIDFMQHFNYENAAEILLHDAAVEEIKSRRWAERVQHDDENGRMRILVTPKAAMNWTLYRSLQERRAIECLKQKVIGVDEETGLPQLLTKIAFGGRNEIVPWMPPIHAPDQLPQDKLLFRKTNLPPV